MTIMPEVEEEEQQQILFCDGTAEEGNSNDDSHNKNNDDDESSLLLLLEPPNEFVCPITHQLMIDPVMSKNGVTYERTAILEWLLNNNNNNTIGSSTSNSNNKCCPLTRQPLKPSMLVSNAALKIKILQWKVDNGIINSCSGSNNTDDDTTSLSATARPISLRSLYFDYSTLLNNNNDSNRSITDGDIRPNNNNNNNNNTETTGEEEDDDNDNSTSVIGSSERILSSSSTEAISSNNNNVGQQDADDMNDLLELYNDVLELIDTNISRSVNINNHNNDANQI